MCLQGDDQIMKGKHVRQPFLTIHQHYKPYSDEPIAPAENDANDV